LSENRPARKAIANISSSPNELKTERTRRVTQFPLIEGRNGAVGTANATSAQVGLEILKQGGNAVDAGVAMVFSLAVTDPERVSFGGEMPALVYCAKEKNVVVVAGQGPAPKAYGIEPTDWTAAVPGQFDACLVALDSHGTLRAADVLEPTIRLAEKEGAPSHAWLGDLARTLRVIAEAEKRNGAGRRAGIRAARDYFYRGPVADAIIQFSREHGGIFAEEDFTGYSAKIEPAVHITYRGHEVYKVGPWTQGPALLEALNILEGFDLNSMGHNFPQYIHTVTSALALAFADRDTFYGDPDFCHIPLMELLSKEYAAARRTLITATALREAPPGDPERLGAIHPGGDPRSQSRPSETRDTAACVAIDRQRNVFCATPSGWGSDIPMGDTGIVLSTRLGSFWPRVPRGHANSPAGGKRPRITLSPTLVLKDGQPFLAISVAGGDKQDQTTLNILLNIIEFGMNPQEAAEAPRVSTLHHTDSFSPGGIVAKGTLDIEEGVPEETLRALEAMGYTLGKGSGSRPVVMLIKPSEGIVQVGAREVHSCVMAW
jgi:gamma-glutamyltranspeptidase/glutathione hydrolase